MACFLLMLQMNSIEVDLGPCTGLIGSLSGKAGSTTSKEGTGGLKDRSKSGRPTEIPKKAGC